MILVGFNLQSAAVIILRYVPILLAVPAKKGLDS